MERDTPAGQLCYLPAGSVESPGGTLADLELCNEEDAAVGTVDGVLIDAHAGRVRYFVVRLTPVMHRFLLPVEALVRVDASSHSAWVDTSSADLRLARFDPDATRPFSDEDAIAAMDASSAA